MKFCKVVFALSLCFALGLSVLSAEAADYDKFPQQPIKVIVPFGAGGSGDLTIRTLLKFVDFGQPAVIINIPGAGATIGTMEAYNSAPDGYTLLANTPAGMIVGGLNGQLSPEVYQKMIPIIVMGVDNPVFCVGKDSPFKTAKEFFEYAKANPEKLRLASAGMSTMYTSALIIQDIAGIKVNYVSFDSSTKSRAALLGGHVETLLATISENKALIEAGDLIPLFVLSKERSPFLPDVPTMIELGYNATGCLGTRGVWAPAGTPDPIVKKLEAAFLKGLKNPEFKKIYLENMGIEPVEWDSATTRAWVDENAIYYKELLEKYGDGK
ncbi:MAG: tripartite tricarboxylate transporter substrate binding protein [Synergistaceae bacterium]|jgi:tripartite-type tricarboxylate transporter receptor subunit TctC|nr:tripartite tricarboxylate transporter substrate binding protein [Synergistaceae bacterium]